jgi:type IV fimbrial biogenesis protein FimT
MSYYLQSGFSLIEMMIVIVILAIALAVGVPNFQEFIANTQIRSVSESIRNGLQVARAEAVKRNEAVTFTLNNNTSWVVSCVPATATCPATIQSKSANEGSGAAITLTMIGGNSIRFTSLGTVDPTVVGQLTQVSIDNNRLPAALSRDLRLTIGAGGNIRVCDPNVAVVTDPRFCS